MPVVPSKAMVYWPFAVRSLGVGGTWANRVASTSIRFYWVVPNRHVIFKAVLDFKKCFKDFLYREKNA